MKEGESSFASSELSDDAEDVQIKCKIGLYERLILSRPIWFLPGIQRAGALHLLQGKEEGIFIVRQSTKPASIALSVRLPPEKGPYVEHYLIQTLPGKKLSLETSSFQFDSLQSLIAHYCQHCDELPVQLKLPFILSSSQSRQELTSLGLLGQEFWSHNLSSLAGLGDLGKKCISLSSLSLCRHPAINICQTDAMTKIIVHDNTINKNSVLVKSPVDTKSLSTFKSDNSLEQSGSPIPPPPPPRWSKPTLRSPSETSDIQLGISDHDAHDNQVHMTVSSAQLKRKPQLLEVSNGNSSRSRRYSCDVLTPAVCYKSSLAEKESDYEDIWTSPTEIKSLTTFKKIDRSIPRSYSVQKKCGSIPFSLTSSKKDKSGLHLSSPSVCRLTSSSLLVSPSHPLYEDPLGQVTGTNLFKKVDHHSDPSLLSCSPYLTNSLEIIGQSRNFLYSSADNVMRLNGTITSEGEELLIPQVPKGSQCDTISITSPKSVNETSWALDSSWEFMENREPKSESQLTDNDSDNLCIPQKFPVSCPSTKDVLLNQTNHTSGLGTEPSFPNPEVVSDYDNIDKKCQSPPSVLSEDGTEFSEPWDSSKWLDNMPSDEHEVQRLQQFIDNILYRREMKSDMKDSDCDSVIQLNVNDNVLYPVLLKSTENNDYNEGCVYPPRLLKLNCNQRCPEASNRIRSHVVELARIDTTIFSKKIKFFIECTKESSETNPYNTLRNIRQFMSGIKNYLVKSELDFAMLVDQERQGLKSTEFLNIDEILEEELHKLLLSPLKDHIYKLFVGKCEDGNKLADDEKSAIIIDKLGVKEYLVAAVASAKLVTNYIKRMQESYSPIIKQELLHLTIASVFRQLRHSTTTSNLSLPVNQFQTVLAYILYETRLQHLEIESEYMWGLLPSSRRVGEWGYYLTLLSGALQLLNQANSNTADMKETEMWGSLRILLPDENLGTIVTKTIPVRVSSTTHDIMTLVAHKQKITNPQDYGLYSLVQGVEQLMNDSDYPQQLKKDLLKSGQTCSFVYRRQDAKIAWPKDTNS